MLHSEGQAAALTQTPGNSHLPVQDACCRLGCECSSVALWTQETDPTRSQPRNNAPPESHTIITWHVSELRLKVLRCLVCGFNFGSYFAKGLQCACVCGQFQLFTTCFT